MTGMACTFTVAGARACLLLLFSHLPIVGRSKFGFVHLVDGMREAGYRGLTPHLPERVSHGSPAERDCTRPADLRGCLQRARVGLGPGAGRRGDSDAGPADGGVGAAGDGPER